MNDETAMWMRYAAENLSVAELCFESDLYNPTVQNAQQAVEKALKALCLFNGLTIKRTHSIGSLRDELHGVGFDCGLADEECELLDSVYLPSKYPLGFALPDFEPGEVISLRCLSIARRIMDTAYRLM